MRVTLTRPLVLLLLSPSFLAAAQPTVIRIPKVTTAPRIEDFLDQRPRQAEVTLSDFRQREPQDGAPASRKTTVHLSYDDHALYAVFVCESDPQSLRARLNKRDQLGADESVNLTIDTFHDRRRAYMFFANPLGVQLDGITTEGQDDDYSFDTVWHSAGRITSTGYIVWMAIPFRSLRFSLHHAKTWGLAVSRYIPDRKEYSAVPHITNRIEGFVEQFATLEGIDNVSPGRNIQFIPYGFASSQRYLDLAPDTPAFRNTRELRAGLDAKMVFGDSLTLDVTVNPDFSQVESDEPQVTVNRRFEVYFPERRPFFLENAGYFETPEQVFFSRRIVNPQFGARLTGKAGKWAFGLLGMDDRATETGLSTDRAAIGVFRLQREFLRQSTLGALFTNRQTALGVNRVVSFDTRLRLANNWVLTAQALHSRTTRRDQPLTTGSSLFTEMRYSGRHLTTYTYYRDRSPGFRADLGFIPRTDIRQLRHVTRYRWRPTTGPVLNFGPSLYATAIWDHHGRLQEWTIDAPFRFEFRGPASIEVSRQAGWELYRNGGYRRDSSYIAASFDRFRCIGFRATYADGRGINYYPAAGIHHLGVGEQLASAGISFTPGRHARIDETYLYTRLSSSGAALNDHVLRSRLNYQFTRALSLRTIFDYRASLTNTTLIDLDRYKRVTADVLLTYQLNHGTALHAGFNTRRENLLLPDYNRAGPPNLTTGRIFFVKLSYLLRL